MKTVSQDGTFEDAIASFRPEIREIARRLRDLIELVHPDAVEVVWLKQRIAGFGLGPKKMTEQVSYIAPQTNYVNLGFYRGTSLPDPAGLLEGTGKALRHVKVHTVEDVERPALKQLLTEAVAERRRVLKLD